MDRPYIICHMVMSIDGKVTGDFLFRKEAEKATEIYYEINRQYKTDAFACGRVTMEESFTNGWYPDLTKYSSVRRNIDLKMDYIVDGLSGFYAVAFDSKGKLGWKSNRIIDEDPGYGNAMIIEVLTEQVDPGYLGYLKEKGISYIFAGESEINLELALYKLKKLFGIEKLLLEGGSIINGAFLRGDLIDEISLVTAPVLADKAGKPLFADSSIADFVLSDIKTYGGGVVWTNYRRNDK